MPDEKKPISLHDLINAAKLRAEIKVQQVAPVSAASVDLKPNTHLAAGFSSPVTKSSVLSSTLSSRANVSRQIASYSPQVYRNRTFDYSEKLSITAKLVDHQAKQAMIGLAPTRSPIIEPVEEAEIIRCNQTGIPFACIPTALCGVSGNYEQFYSSPFAMHKNSINYSEFMLIAPEAYLTQYIFSFCHQMQNSQERFISSFAMKQFERRCNFFDLLYTLENDVNPETDEIIQDSLLSKLLGVTFLLHRGGCRKLPNAVRDSAEYRQLTNLILQDEYLANDPRTPSHSLAMQISFVQQIYDLLISLLARHLLHYNPLIYHRMSPEFGITITYADFEQVRAIHNTSTIPQITRKQIVEQQKQKQISDAVEFLHREGFAFTLTKI